MENDKRDLGALSGSHASHGAAEASPPVGFDPARVEDTYENEGPKCPYCGRQYTADEPEYYDEQNYTEETCDDCGLTFDVDVYTSTSWSCSARASAMSASGQDAGERLEGDSPASAPGRPDAV